MSGGSSHGIYSTWLVHSVVRFARYLPLQMWRTTHSGEFILLEPWILGVARLVPSFLWPNKPSAEYFSAYVSGFAPEFRETAGVAAPQHAEFLLQFGWPGFFVLSFLAFSVVGALVKALHKLSWELGGTDCWMCYRSGFFGFYIQQRGYFSQVLDEVLFTFGPLFIVQWWGMGRSANSSL